MGTAVGAMLSPLLGVISGVGIGVTIGTGIVLAYTAWGRWIVVTRFWLPLTGRTPWALTAFLREAHRVGVLRQSGGVFQFRHARLQERLQSFGG